MKKLLKLGIIGSILTSNLFAYGAYPKQKVESLILQKKIEIRVLEKADKCLKNANSKKSAKNCVISLKKEMKKIEKKFFIKNKKMFLKHLTIKANVLKNIKKDIKKSNIVMKLEKCIEPTNNKMEFRKCITKYKPLLKK